MQQHLEHGIRVHEETKQCANVLLVHEANEAVDQLVSNANGQNHKEEKGIAD